MGGSVPILYSRNINSDLFVYALRSVYANSNRIYDINYAIQQDPDFPEKALRDPVVAHAIYQRLHRVAPRTWHVEPGGDQPEDKLAADVVSELVDGIDRLAEARYELAQAVIRDRSYAFIEARRTFKILAKSLPQNWWSPTRLKDIDARRFRLVPKVPAGGKDPVDVRLELFSIQRGKWEEVDPAWFVIHTYQDEEARLGLGRGLLEAIYFYYWMKQRVMEQGLQGVERWAQGLVAVEIDGLREASEDLDNKTVARKWLDVLTEMRSRNFLIHGKDDKIAVHETSGTGHQLVMEFVRYLDDSLTRLILGSVLPTGGGEGGSYAKAQVEEDSTETLLQYDQTILDEALTRDLVGAIWRNNQQQFAAIGCAFAKMPKFVSLREKRSDPKQAVEVVKTALDAGIKLKREEVYERIGFSPPGPEDEIIEGRSAPAFPGFPGGGGFGAPSA